MQNYKDSDNNVHVLESEKFKHLLPVGSVKITQAQADVLSAPPVKTSAEINADKDARVEAELGSDMVRIIMETIIPLINPSLNVTDIINQAKAKRKSEL
jgi:hypothetical protein